MGSAPVCILRLFIPEGSLLAEGRLPVDRRRIEGGWIVDLDPVSLAALLASVGRPCTVAQAAEEIPSLTRSRAEAAPQGPASGREGA